MFADKNIFRHKEYKKYVIEMLKIYNFLLNKNLSLSLTAIYIYICPIKTDTNDHVQV